MLENLRKDLLTDLSTWQGVLFVLAEFFGFYASYSSFSQAEAIYKGELPFSNLNFALIILSCLSFFLRIPYLRNKSLALVLLFINGVFAFITSIFYILAYFKTHFEKHS